MALLNSFPGIENAFEPSGSNFLNGFSAGNAVMPGANVPGVPVGAVHTYIVKQPQPSQQVGDVINLVSNVPYTVKLDSINFPHWKKVRFGPNSADQGYQLDYPRQFYAFTEGDPGPAIRITFNYIDRYMNKNTATTVANIFGPQGGINILNSIEFLSPVNTTVRLVLAGFLELPFTDYGIPSLTLKVIRQDTTITNPASSYPMFSATTSTFGDVVGISCDFLWFGTLWNNPDPNFYRPRSLFLPAINGVPINTATNDYLVQQMVFPTFNPVFQKQAEALGVNLTQEDFESGVAAMGAPPDPSTAALWTGWKG